MLGFSNFKLPPGLSQQTKVIRNGSRPTHQRRTDQDDSVREGREQVVKSRSTLVISESVTHLRKKTHDREPNEVPRMLSESVRCRVLEKSARLIDPIELDESSCHAGEDRRYVVAKRLFRSLSRRSRTRSPRVLAQRLLDFGMMLGQLSLPHPVQEHPTQIVL